MQTNVIVIENENDLNEARELVSRLMGSDDPTDRARLRAQALMLQEYEAKRWPVEPASPAEIIQYLMEQHDLTPADMAPILGTRSRVSEVLNGRRPLNLSMIKRLRTTFHISADALIRCEDIR
jgi:HTH-type transcriptional regulator/antitoxin HigA